jgi:hypothetical protein
MTYAVTTMTLVAVNLSQHHQFLSSAHKSHAHKMKYLGWQNRIQKGEHDYETAVAEKFEFN